MASKKAITGGVYLVVDPSYGETGVLSIAKICLESGLDVLQLWAPWKEKKGNEKEQTLRSLGRKLSELASSYCIPFIVNNDLDVARRVGADGVHIDGYDPSPSKVFEIMGRGAIAGITCSADIEKVRWATEEERATYISFCSIYPSPSVDECDLVPLSIVSQARTMTRIPIFASGGITTANAGEVLRAGADGVAVISEIMKSPDPAETMRKFKEIVNEATLVRSPASF